MASSKEYLEFILGQLSELEEITYRAMMGEFIIYYRGKIVGGIYDDRLLVKPVKAAISYMPTAPYELPYEGAKQMLLVDEVEFGNRKHDKALVAEMQGNVIGAIWVRIMNDYGHIDNDTPSLAMSVYKKYRGLGIGTSLLKQLLQVERLAGYSKISLSVQKSNYAVKMYEKVGFTVADENNEEYIMIVNL